MRPFSILGYASASLYFALCCPLSSYAQEKISPTTATTTSLPAVTIRAEQFGQIGSAEASSAGVISAASLQAHPLQRPTDILEAIPGVIITQHSGSGKANQYFLRGFNLDHGTDISTSLLGIPLNQPTHAHGQGYLDLNLVIPELVKEVQYKKGPYFADEGNFSTAAASHIRYVDQFAHPFLVIEAGAGRYQRALLAGSTPLAHGKLLGAIEVTRQDGPWDVPEAAHKTNAYLSYSPQLDKGEQLQLGALLYQNRWNASNQVPQRLLDAGTLGRYGNLDASDGGLSHRYALSLQGKKRVDDQVWQVNAYLTHYGLNLFSNHTWALENPEHGDQHEQSERRKSAGLQVQNIRNTLWQGKEIEHVWGLQTRSDQISQLGLYQTQQRTRWNTLSDSQVQLQELALYGSSTVFWLSGLRSTVGLRADHYRLRVASNLAANSGNSAASLLSPKFALVYAPEKHVELYLNAGRGFHTNDARGTTAKIDPNTGEAQDKLPVFAAAIGAEIGVRVAQALPGLESTLSLWQLASRSELVYSGDAGTTDAGRPSIRRGVEMSHRYQVSPQLQVELDAAYSHPRYSDYQVSGNFIPDSIERMASAAVLWQHGPWQAALRARYFGERPLTDDNTQRSKPSLLLNAKITYRLQPQLLAFAEVINLANRRVNDMDYFYASRLPGEAAAVPDRHSHPALPRSVRLGLQWSFD